ncbi:hypothetical protein PBI_SMARTIES_80 [Microbacterium phage Smarties]|uniref:Uncharacterized protein n=1 Tax=Microbacterium phage Ariadne TaxID=2656546 RepID=A0A649VCF8_9CAUD|nr:hypothetical protein QDA10_gp080 [Microbacterium phage Ariadne]QGJ89483.1 hypothetical protein PBI_ARIADNE_80 [Microbacterium phage Ariadne]QGJ91470.1 hypothetical protein PBI_SMARTIES_80 [Microbacterium phage Smarties]
MTDSGEVCGAPFAIGHCDRPPHPEGTEHHATMTPPAPMQMILDAAAKAKRSADRWRLFFLVATAAQVALYIHRLIEGVPA